MDGLEGEWTSQAVEGGHDGGPDPDYVRATRAMEEEEKRRLAEEACRAEAAPPPPSPDQAAEVLKSAPAYYLLHAMGPSGLGIGHDLAAQEAHLGDFLAEAGSPADPVERLLLQQLFLAHHAVGRLHVRAGVATDPQAIVAFLGAAARLTAELRRLALALEAYRESSAARKAKQAEKKRAQPPTAARLAPKWKVTTA